MNDRYSNFMFNENPKNKLKRVEFNLNAIFYLTIAFCLETFDKELATCFHDKVYVSLPF